MKNLFKKAGILGMVLSSILVMNSVPAFASETKVSNEEVYKEICESLSEEYGTTISYVSDEEAEKLGIEINRPSPKEFEKEIRENVEKGIKHNEEVQKMSEQAKLNSQTSDKAVLSSDNIRASRSSTVRATQKKGVTGGTIILKSEICTSGSYNHYVAVDELYSLVAWSYPKFASDVSVSYNFIDSGRTCAATLKGHMIQAGGYHQPWSEYVEFHASSI